MTRWLRILVTCLSLATFLFRNTSALGDCHHDHEAEVAMLASQADDSDRDSSNDADGPTPSHDAPCEAPGGCVHCTVAKMPCAAPAAALTNASVCLGDVLVETSLDYTAPSSGRLIRPPR